MTTCRCIDTTLFGDECRCDRPAGPDGLCDTCRTSLRCSARRQSPSTAPTPSAQGGTGEHLVIHPDGRMDVAGPVAPRG